MIEIVKCALIIYQEKSKDKNTDKHREFAVVGKHFDSQRSSI